MQQQQQREQQQEQDKGMTALFVYGTLMADEVLATLLHRVPQHKPATLSGFSRHSIKGVVYPAIIPSTADSSVSGLVRSRGS